MKQHQAPLWDALAAYRDKQVLPFHTPGHKLRSGVFSTIRDELGEGFFALDPSDEVESEPYGNDFEAVLEEAQKLAAQLFGAQNSLFLVNGTTGGLHYLLAPTTGTVIVPRFSHQAVYSGLALSEGAISYIPTQYDPEWQIPLPPSPDQFESLLTQNNCQAVVLTYPTYYGTVPDLSTFVNVAEEHQVMVFVDEAHGGHFRFSSKLPKPALSYGVDGVVQSTHKTLGSFTQTSMLHSNNPIWYEKVLQARDVLQTTSPSLVFLAVLDEVRRTLAEKGQSLVENTLYLAHECRRELSQIPLLQLLPECLQSDPTKIVFSLREIGLTGIAVERLLRTDYNIQVELSDYYNVLALITLGDTKTSIRRLIEAIRDIVDRRSHLGSTPLPRHKVDFPPLPKAVMSLREAFFIDVELAGITDSIGRVSGGFVTPYPPGVPVVVPGEIITAEIVEYLLWCLQIGWPVRGVEGKKMSVIKDNRDF